MNEILLIVGMMAVTFSVRYPVLALVGRMDLPDPVNADPGFGSNMEFGNSTLADLRKDLAPIDQPFFIDLPSAFGGQFDTDFTTGNEERG